MFSNGNSFGLADGNSMDLGSGNSYGPGSQARDGSRPASARWMFAVLIWRI
jgi:hypothetical protein